MDIRIGVTHTAKELAVELPDGAEPEATRAEVESMLGNDGGMLWLTDRKGRQIGIPVAKVAYVEIGSPDAARRIGFAGA